MWLRRNKARNRVHDAPTLKFACSSFKDVHSLLYDDADSPRSPSSPSIYHRNRSAKELLRSLSIPAAREIRIRGAAAENSVVVYFTSLRVIRRTFDDCSAVRSILRSFRVPIDERDLAMDSRFMEELQRILGEPEKSLLTLPRVFTGGRYLGGAEEVRRLHESGELKKHLEGLPPAEPGTCGVCGGYGFVLCKECDGSHKCYYYRGKKGGFRSCTSCNENGLVRCPSCSCSPAPTT
ncbi:uncharacterized protein At5g39865 [Salvia hispanica]|uniref:uncharacterized protein At5g39865 n=1 Tax=Salvia hispanica TaxID=49212 RepID=UPI002009C3BE|nr:uncharacterized protein At5g39865 [Salvia hispanica]